MVKFSSEHQPTAEARLREVCRKDHPMMTGDPNVRIRRDGRRVCRACESAHQAKRYQSMLALRQPIPTPFSLDNLWFDEQRYENTTIPLLQKFIDWQRSILNQTKAAAEGSSVAYSGGRLSREFILETLEAEIPKTEAVIVRRAISTA